MALSPVDMEKYRKTARRRQEVAEKRRLQRLEQAWKVARQAAQILCNEFQAQEVAVFGSLVHPELFHLRSDIDLAVWGLQERLYLQAVARVTSLDPDISVDLIAIEESSQSLREHIQDEAIPI
ncbi:nucleotidyltransferase family protein [Desulfovermiculus halophilus]|uniref:nucleotidyltransferase family protein n=1 Tax=Desulfovermiculus halophilus TaxID=339722 RepID=UPI0004884A9C|nr:nucleotidyltransferase domain-containing protein [Desulfovermiculus halophilus]